jgi:hypothetical protein
MLCRVPRGLHGFLTGQAFPRDLPSHLANGVWGDVGQPSDAFVQLAVVQRWRAQRGDAGPCHDVNPAAAGGVGDHQFQGAFVPRTRACAGEHRRGEGHGHAAFEERDRMIGSYWRES